MAPQAGDAMSPPIKLGPPQRLRKHTRHISDMESESEFGDFPKDQDRDVLLEEEEREKLLSKGWFGSLGKQEGGVKIGKWTKGRRRLQGLGRRIFRRNEEDSGNEDEAERFFDKDEPEYKPRKPSVKWVACVSVGLLTFLLFVIIGSVQLSIPKKISMPKHATMSNGTHLFFPTTIMISLDGFRPDFLDPELTPTLLSLAKAGVRPPYMTPAFPSVTFPNHWTLVTGLHPESHGIVSNHFWDPELKREFHYTDPARSLQPEWWGGEPIWSTAERQGVKAAIHMWPGSEVAYISRIKPTFVDKFVRNETLSLKADKIINWLDQPTRERPQLILSYVPNVDIAGHKYGPNTTEVRSSIAEVDNMLSGLFTSIQSRNLTHITNIIIVSDHGMLTTTSQRLLYLDDLLPNYKSLIYHIEGWPLYGMRPRPGISLETLHQTLLASQAATEDVILPYTLDGKKVKPFQVYTRETMPKRFHYANNPRIAPLWIVPEPGWIISTREEHPDKDAPFHPIGVHGYDNQHPLMRSLFIARGPAFEGLHGSLAPNSTLKKSERSDKQEEVEGKTVAPFGNWEVYGLIADSLGLKWRTQGVNGTMGIAGMTLLQTPSSAIPLSSSSSSSPSSSSSILSTTASSTTSISTIQSQPTSTPSPAPGWDDKKKEEESPPPSDDDEDDSDDEDDDEKEDKKKGKGTGHAAKEKLKGWWSKFKHKASGLKDKLEEWWDGVWVDREDD